MFHILLAIGKLVTNGIQWTEAGGRVRVTPGAGATTAALRAGSLALD